MESGKWTTNVFYFFFFSVLVFQDISCIKDLTSLYEAATIEDIYLAYEQLKVDEDSLYSCIGVAGSQAGDEITGKGSELEVVKFSFFSVLISSVFGFMSTKISGITKLSLKFGYSSRNAWIL